MNKALSIVFIAAILTWCVQSTGAGEVHSNGTGGGLWSDPATWHGGKAPTAEDTAIVSTRDVVEFDHVPDANPDDPVLACAALAIDPAGVLTFKSAAGPVCRLLVVGGSVTNYGTIRLDATRSPLASFELRLAGHTPTRVIRLYDKAQLLLYGAAGLPEDQRNIILSVGQVDQALPNTRGEIIAPAQTMIDLHRVAMAGMELTATGIDNTGYTANERLNVIGCVFTGPGRITLRSCDSPRVAENRFRIGQTERLPAPAISMTRSALTQIQGNTIHGYAQGVIGRYDNDPAISDNVFENCGTALDIHTVNNVMISRNTVRDCDRALSHVTATGAVDRLTIERTPNAILLDAGAALQVTGLRLTPTGDREPIAIGGGTLTLLNSNIEPALVRFHARVARDTSVRSMSYLVVAVSGKTYPQTRVEVRTVGASADTPDPNVRNSPAMILSNGMTPLPRSQRALVVQGWSLDHMGELTAAPRYTLTVVDPPLDERSGPRVRATMELSPDATWVRPDPDAPKATVEVRVR